MAYVELGDFFAIAKILAVLLASGFALYFPLVAWLKNKKNALALTIPASISVEIIFGYIFYSFDATSFFPGVYLAVIIILNVLAILKIKKANIQSEDGWKFKIQDLALFLVVAAAAFYTRFYDAIKNIAPGGIDTPAHITYLKEMS